MPQQILNAVVHKIEKETTSDAQLILATALLDREDKELHSLVEQVQRIYSERSNKQYGEFDVSGETPGIRAYLEKLYADDGEDFLTLSDRMMHVLKGQADEQNFATGGHVLIVDSTNGATRWFVVAMLNSVDGSWIDENFRILRAPHVDLEGLRFAGRVNMTAWQANEGPRYISFLGGRSNDVSRYFQRFLGCTTVKKDLQDTRNLIDGIKQFAKDRGMSREATQTLEDRAYESCEELVRTSVPVSIEAFCNRVFPDDPDALSEALAKADPPIADGFMIAKRGLTGLKKFIADGPGWRLDFDREQMTKDTIRFDRDARSLIITNLPADVIEALNHEFPPETPTDSA